MCNILKTQQFQDHTSTNQFCVCPHLGYFPYQKRFTVLSILTVVKDRSWPWGKVCMLLITYVVLNRWTMVLLSST